MGSTAVEESSLRGYSSRQPPPEVTVKENQPVLSSNQPKERCIGVYTAIEVYTAVAGVLHSPAGTVIVVLELVSLYPEILYDKRGNLLFLACYTRMTVLLCIFNRKYLQNLN